MGSQQNRHSAHTSKRVSMIFKHVPLNFSASASHGHDLPIVRARLCVFVIETTLARLPRTNFVGAIFAVSLVHSACRSFVCRFLSLPSLTNSVHICVVVNACIDFPIIYVYIVVRFALACPFLFGCMCTYTYDCSVPVLCKFQKLDRQNVQVERISNRIGEATRLGDCYSDGCTFVFAKRLAVRHKQVTSKCS